MSGATAPAEAAAAAAAAEEAEALGVPAEMRAAFAELAAALAEAFPGKPVARRRLADWCEDFREARALTTVHSFKAAHAQALVEAARALALASGAKEELVLRSLEQRLTFVAVYATSLSLEDALAQVTNESRLRLQQLQAEAPGGFRLVPGVFEERHMQLRLRAYPYHPACCSRHGETVLECRCAGSDELVGFMALHDGYADDLSLDPRCQGRGLAKALVGGAAVQLARAGRKFISLDVRACNLPAIELYKSLGFEIKQKHYPCFYDWHGGYSMKALTEKVAAHLPTSVDSSSLA
mmetsp:Transcript_80291/g.236152  ORF Transcript_80291/g.236152 Transcript_80291/m.236152 type:complete len:295 (-) Transcript_80291:135-1019(-)